MAQLPQIIREYVLGHKADPAPWTITEAGPMLLISAIPDRIQADRLHEYLAGRGYLVSVGPADKRRTAWTLSARPYQLGQADVDGDE